MKQILIFLMSTILCFNLKAQLVLGISQNSPNIEVSSFYIAKVTDSTNSPMIGIVHDKNGVKHLKVFITNSPEQSIFYKLVQRNNSRYPIELVIKKVFIDENKTDKLLDGEFTLIVDFYSIKENHRSFLLTATAKQNFKRSEGDIKTSSLDLLLLNNIRQTYRYLDQWINLNQGKHPAFASTSEVIILNDYAINHLDTVYHSTRPLVWDDFRGVPNNSYSASIFSSIAYTMEMTVKNNTILAKITPKVYMVKGMSWVKAFAKDNETLAHEQLHFDIAQVVMNRFCKRLKELKETTIDDLQSRIQYEYLETYREMNRLQKAYDGETKHGILKQNQKEWSIKVKNWLVE